MEKSLQILIKNTKTGCEQTYRNLVSCMNGLAGVHIINNDYDKAIDTYEQILNTEKEYESKIVIDNLQKIHALHNLTEILVTHKNQSDQSNLKREVKTKHRGPIQEMKKKTFFNIIFKA